MALFPTGIFVLSNINYTNKPKPSIALTGSSFKCLNIHTPPTFITEDLSCYIMYNSFKQLIQWDYNGL